MGKRWSTGLVRLWGHQLLEYTRILRYFTSRKCWLMMLWTYIGVGFITFLQARLRRLLGNLHASKKNVHPAARRGQQKWLLFHIGRFISIYETFYECSHPFTYTYMCNDVSKCNVFCCWFEVNVQSIFIVLVQFSILAPGVNDTFNVKQEVLRNHRSCKENICVRYFSSVAVHIFQAAHGPHDILPCGQKWVILPCASFESTNSDRIEIRALACVDPGTYQSPEIGTICCPCLGTRCSMLLGLAGLAISVQTMVTESRSDTCGSTSNLGHHMLPNLFGIV